MRIRITLMPIKSYSVLLRMTRRMPMNEIEKIKYSISRFDVERMVMGKRDVYEIFSDGRVDTMSICLTYPL